MGQFRNRQAGLSLVEVIVAFGVLAVLSLSLPSLISQMTSQHRSLQQKAEMNELMASLKMILRDRNNCHFNLIKDPLNSVPIHFDPSTNHSLSEIAQVTPTGTKRMVIQAGAPFAKGSGLITLNPSSDPNNPGLVLRSKGSLGTDLGGNNKAYAAEIVVTASKVIPGGAAVTLSDRLPVNVVVDKNNQITDCYAQTFAIGTDLQNDICATMSQANQTFSYYDAVSNKCIPNCATGTDTQADCPGGGRAVTCNVSPGFVDANATLYHVPVTMQGGGSQMIPPQAVFFVMSGSSCQCFWGDGVAPRTQCKVCCATF